MFATCIAAAVGTLLMGLLTNYPFAMAPGMGINAYFAYTVVLTMKYDWHVALGAVFISGVVFIILTLVRVRALIVDAIPLTLKTAVAAGIGLFIAFIGLKNAGVIVASPATFVRLGDITSAPVALALLGLVLTGALMARGHKSAMIVSIIAVTVGAIALGLATRPSSILQKPDWHSTGLAAGSEGSAPAWAV
jgi:AGZA family xanthine/uracil permease-like MFS transporter